MHWSNGPLLGFDTETTGVKVSSDRLVTAALVLRQDGTDRVTTWLADPGVEIPPSATQIHGITTDYARANGQDISQVLDQVTSRLHQALTQGIPTVAFNGAYDLQILHNESRRHGVATLEERLGHPVAPVIDPLVLDRAVDRYRKGKRTLADLMRVYQVTPPGGDLHTAEVDVQATLDVLEALLQRHPKLREYSLVELHQFQVEAHRAWAQNFNQFLASRGRPADAELDWPMPRHA